MDTTPLSRAIELDWLAASHIGPYVVAFKEHLTELRYSASTIADYLADIKHFARWVQTRRLPLAWLDEVMRCSSYLPTLNASYLQIPRGLSF